MDTDRGAIENLLARYCTLYDEGDFEGYAQLFAHGRVVGPTASLVGPEEIRAYHERNCLLYDGVPLTRHVTTNLHIEIDEAGTGATASSYVTVFQATPALALQPIFVGRYHDRLEKVDGVWRFAERRAEPSLVGDLSHHAREYLPPTVGTQPGA